MFTVRLRAEWAVLTALERRWLASSIPGPQRRRTGGTLIVVGGLRRFNALVRKVTSGDMRAMNEAIDRRHRDPAEVVKEFRDRKRV